MLEERLKAILPRVQKPGRYIGLEHNAVVKEWSDRRVRVALAFPDVYEIGMSYLGMRILYGLLSAHDDILCERVFAPWPDMEALLREEGIRLYGLESKRPLADFDIIGVSLTYELHYTNLLTMLDLGGIPLRAADRTERDALVIAGGPAAYNPEPMAAFIDAFVIGDGEEALPEVIEAARRFITGGRGTGEKKMTDRAALLKALAAIEGVYVPGLYQVAYRPDGTIAGRAATGGAPQHVRKRVVKDLDASFYPVAQVVPLIQIVHDRIALEIMRGCPHLCAFCQAGTVCLPRRVRGRKRIVELALGAYARTGYDEVSLISLSSGDYPQIRELFGDLREAFRGKAVSVSMPSLRIEEVTDALPQLIREVRKTGLTFAPESGCRRLRRMLNKNIDTEKLISAVREAYRAGWNRVKLYFMIGLPTESHADLEETVRLIEAVALARKETGKAAGFVNASIASFVPKPHTPLQWRAMEPREVLEAKQEFLRRRNTKRGKIRYDFHPVATSILEAVFARGDRRLDGVVEEAWRAGARFDGWRECFDAGRWDEAFRRCGIDTSFYVHRERPYDEMLPWDFIEPGLARERLVRLAGGDTGGLTKVPD